MINIQSDKCIRNIKAALKFIDDVLTQGTSYLDLKTTLKHLFDNFRRFIVKIKPSKFRVGRDVKFGAFLCGAGEERVYVKTDMEKRAALASVQHKKE